MPPSCNTSLVLLTCCAPSQGCAVTQILSRVCYNGGTYSMLLSFFFLLSRGKEEPENAHTELSGAAGEAHYDIADETARCVNHFIR